MWQFLVRMTFCRYAFVSSLSLSSQNLLHMKTTFSNGVHLREMPVVESYAYFDISILFQYFLNM